MTLKCTEQNFAHNSLQNLNTHHDRMWEFISLFKCSFLYTYHICTGKFLGFLVWIWIFNFHIFNITFWYSYTVHIYSIYKFCTYIFCIYFVYTVYWVFFFCLSVFLLTPSPWRIPCTSLTKCYSNIMVLWWFCISVIVVNWIYSYWFFPIHGLHPQPPVGLRESLQGDDAMPAHEQSSFITSPINRFIFQTQSQELCALWSVTASHLSTTSISKQKRLSMESVFLLTHDRSLNISGTAFTTPFCQHRDVFALNVWCWK